MSEAIVRAVVDAHPEFLTPIDRDEAKAALLPHVVRAMNLANRTTDWGVLVKTNQGNKIPNDIICWRPTREIVDVLSDNGAMWDPKGTAPDPAWIWQAVPPESVGGFPAPVIPPAQGPSPTQADINAIVSAIVNGVVLRLLPVINDHAQIIEDQNERIFADLTRQNANIRALLEPRQVLPTQPREGIHLPPEAVDRVTDIASSVLQILANRRR